MAIPINNGWITGTGVLFIAQTTEYNYYTVSFTGTNEGSFAVVEFSDDGINNWTKATTGYDLQVPPIALQNNILTHRGRYLFPAQKAYIRVSVSKYVTGHNYAEYEGSDDVLYDVPEDPRKLLGLGTAATKDVGKDGGVALFEGASAGSLNLREAARRAGVTIAGNGVLTGNHITGSITGTDDTAAFKITVEWAKSRGYTLDGEGLTYYLAGKTAIENAGTVRLSNARFLLPATKADGTYNHEPLWFSGSNLDVRLDRIEVVYVGIPNLLGVPSPTTIIRADSCRSFYHQGCKITSHSVIGAQILTTDVYDVSHQDFVSIKYGDATTGNTDYYAIGSQNATRGGRVIYSNCRVQDGRGAHSWFYVSNFYEVRIDRVVVLDCAYSRAATDDIANGILVSNCGQVSLTRCIIDVLVNMSNDVSLRVGPYNALFRTKHARGIALSNCDDISVDDVTSKLVDQTFDFSGSGKGRRLRVSNCTSWQSGAWGIKNANGWQDVSVKSCDIWFPGAAGYVVSDSITTNPNQPKNIHCDVVRVYHPGAARRFDGSDDDGKGFYSGFFVITSQASSGNPGPSGVTIGQGCRAEDATTAIVSIDADTGGSNLPNTLTLTAPTPTGGRPAILKPRLIDGVLAVVEIVDPGFYPAGSYPSGIVPITVGGVGAGVAPTVRGFLGGAMVFGALNRVPFNRTKIMPITISDDFRSVGHSTAAHKGFHQGFASATVTTDKTFSVGSNDRITFTETSDNMGMFAGTSGYQWVVQEDGWHEFTGVIGLGTSPNNVGFRVEVYDEIGNAYRDTLILQVPNYVTSQAISFGFNAYAGSIYSLMGTLPVNAGANAGATILVRAGSKVTFRRAGALRLN